MSYIKGHLFIVNTIITLIIFYTKANIDYRSPLKVTLILYLYETYQQSIIMYALTSNLPRLISIISFKENKSKYSLNNKTTLITNKADFLNEKGF